jgi:uncharacterized protein YkwD
MKRFTAAFIGASVVVASTTTISKPSYALCKNHLFRCTLNLIHKQHNYYRDKHCVPRLEWSVTLFLEAKAWADRCTFDHNDPERVQRAEGENIAAWSIPYGVQWDWPVNAWYGEIQYYDYNNPVFNKTTGHFTQVVWKSTTHVGCAKAICPHAGGQWDYWVCRYSPSGNVDGQFLANVPPPC